MKTNKTTQAKQYAKIIDGFNQHYKPSQVISINGSQKKVAEVVQRIQNVVDLAKRSANAQATWRETVRVEREGTKAIASTVRAVRNIIAGAFGENSKQLLDFGFTPRKQTKTTVEVKAEAVKKLRSTREARHTMGAKEKRKIKGGATSGASQGGSGGASASNGGASTNGATTSNGSTGKATTTTNT